MQTINAVKSKYDKNVKLMLRWRNFMDRPYLLHPGFIWDCRCINFEQEEFISGDATSFKVRKNNRLHLSGYSKVGSLLIYAWNNLLSLDTKRKMEYNDLELIEDEWWRYYKFFHHEEKRIDHMIDIRNKQLRINLIDQ